MSGVVGFARIPRTKGILANSTTQSRFDYLRIVGAILVTVQHVLTLTDRRVRQFHFGDDR